MVAAKVIGNDATITNRWAVGQLPVERDAAGDRLQPSREYPAAGDRVARAGGQRHRRLQGQRGAHCEALDRNPILVTALNPVIGYEKGAAIAKKATRKASRFASRRKDDRSAARGTGAVVGSSGLARGGIKGGTSGGG